MKEKFVEYNVDKLKKTNKYSDKDIRIYRYGIETFYSLLTKMLAVILLSTILGTLKETLYLIFFYTILRMFAFGIHASNNKTCWIITLSVYGLLPFLIKYLNINSVVYYIICIPFVLSIFLYAPADTPKRPLIHKKKRERNKLITIVSTILLLFLSVIDNRLIIQNAILFAIIMEGICVNPLTYKIAHTQFNNYLYYKKSVV